MILLIGVGILMILVGGLMFLISAFGVSIWWGIFCIVFPPTNLLFLLLNWKVAKRGFLVQLAGFLLIFVALFVMSDYHDVMPNRSVMSMHQFNWSSSSVQQNTLPAAPSTPDPGNVIDPQALGNLPVLPDDKK